MTIAPLVERPCEATALARGLTTYVVHCVVCRRAWRVHSAAEPTRTPPHRCAARKHTLDEIEALLATEVDHSEDISELGS